MTNATGFNIDGTIYRIDYNTLVNKPEAYTLPTASTTVLGGVKVDGSTIGVNGGVISLANFLANDTIITVGSTNSDFTTLQDAINSLSGKFSSGTVTISMSDESFLVTSVTGSSTCILINTENFNFEKLIITGATQSGSTTITTTIISSSIPANGSMIEVRGSGTKVELNNIYFDCTSSSNTAVGLNVVSSNCTSSNCKFNNFSNTGISVIEDSNVRLSDIEIDGSSVGISCIGSHLVLATGSTLTMNTVTTGISVTNGGIVKLLTVTKAFTSVTTDINLTIGTATADGLALGSWS